MTDPESPLVRILADGVTRPFAPLSHAVRVGQMVLISGIIPFRGEREIAVDDFPAQMRQVMENLGAVLRAAGSDYAHVAKLEVQLIRPGDFGDMNRIYGEYFAPGAFPARATSMVKALPVPEFLVQVHGMAVVAG
ncbi:RidA family protein [Humitalea sp. 24SJ18S-53]|uniref:RidA family protein n=1 Tax=Humitalea sp. 24SJ18S-53 TaxID=3422307 RepID=UPI003D677FFF